MDLEYYEWDAGQSDAFPGRTTLLRPTIRITLRYRDKHLTPLAQIDSGADYCLFPAAFGRPLDLDVESGKQEVTDGIGSGTVRAYFHEVEIVVGTYSLQVWAGFSAGIGTALLGQQGFFDQFEVCFRYPDRRISLRPYGTI